jgi:hypothetical protein
VSDAGSHPRADSVDEQIAALLESIELELKEAQAPRRPAREAAPSRRAMHEAAQTRRGRRPLKAWLTPLTGHPRPTGKARGLSMPRVRTRTSGFSLADEAAPELAFFLGAALIVGAGVGLLVGLFA